MNIKKPPILIFGLIGSGKDTVMELLQKELNDHNYATEYDKLGLYIRKHIDEMFYPGMTANHREAYQTYGECMRTLFGETVWCDMLAHRQKKFEKNKTVIVGDARRPYEYDYFRQYHAFTIALKVDDETRIKRLHERDNELQTNQLNHMSELDCKRVMHTIQSINAPYHTIIENNHDISTLKQQVKQLAAQYIDFVKTSDKS